MRRRSVLLVAALVVCVAVVVAVAVYLGTRSDERESLAPAPRTAAAGPLQKFYEQKLAWTSCDGGTCTWVRVPVDYEKPDGATLRLRVLWIGGSGHSRQALFVNPGGPGGSALDFARQLSGTFGSAVTRAYDVVGVDPRGVGQSDPVECLTDRQMDAYVAADITPDDDAELRDFQQSTRTFGERCLKRSGELAAHVSTEEAARDMDVVRGALGQKRLNWFGASYGTQLGATYATLFPKNVGRMVLDGAVDPDESSIASALGQATGFQRALDAYAASCARSSGCPVGSTPAEATRRLSTFFTQLDREPLKASGSRRLTESNAFFGVAVTLYSQESWPVLTQALRAAFDGDGSILLRLSDVYFDRAADGTYSSNQGQVISAVSCLDDARRPTLEAMLKRVPEFEKASPVFGRALALGAAGCSVWPAPAAHPQRPVDAQGSAPILVVGTTRDPATPYENARRLADELRTGVLLTRDGDGHTAYLSGNACITKAVDAYLVRGTVPKDGTRCAAS